MAVLLEYQISVLILYRFLHKKLKPDPLVSGTFGTGRLTYFCRRK